MSDTPRTDEQINGKPCTRFAILDGDSLRDALVASEFARQLERELNAAAKERDEALALLGFYRTNALEQRQRITQLSEERNALKKRVFELQDLQNSIGIAIMNFGKQLKRDT